MRKLLCYLLFAWLGLLSVSASAHGIHDVAQHQTNATSAATQSHAENEAAPAQQIANDAAQHELCTHAHCGHSHTAGLATYVGVQAVTAAQSALPALSVSWFSSAIANNIERPKWSTATPAVVSLLT